MFAHLLPDPWEEFLQDEKFSHATSQCFKVCYEDLRRGFHGIFGGAAELGYNIVSVGTGNKLVEGE